MWCIHMINTLNTTQRSMHCMHYIQYWTVWILKLAEKKILSLISVHLFNWFPFDNCLNWFQLAFHFLNLYAFSLHASKAKVYLTLSKYCQRYFCRFKCFNLLILCFEARFAPALYEWLPTDTMYDATFNSLNLLCMRNSQRKIRYYNNLSSSFSDQNHQ